MMMDATTTLTNADGRDVKVIKNKAGDEFTPCAVYEKKVGNRVVKRIGAQAKLHLSTDYEHVATEFKQKLGLKDWYFEFPSLGEKATAADLSAEILRELVESVKLREGEDIYSALITVPAAFLNPMYEDTKKAGEKAGIKYVEVLEEPIAAALAYGLKSDPSSKGRWLAYDLGGGTFDAALIKIENGIFAVFDHEGLPYLGGKNLDALIVEKYFLPVLPMNIKEKIIPENSLSWWVLKIMAEEAKCQLSTEDECMLDSNVDSHKLEYTLTRKHLDVLESEIFAPTIEKCRELLKRNNFTSKDVDKVILIGGPTLSPHLREMIEKGLGIPVDFSIDPLTAVAKGAAIYAAGRKIPAEILEEILNDIGVKTEVKGKTSIDIDLNYPAITREEDTLVTGVLKSTNKEVTISAEWYVEINRVDKAGNVLWASGEIPLSGSCKFAKMVSLEEGKNEFNVVVSDAQGSVVATRGNTFSITVTSEYDAAKLPRGIGIANEYGNMMFFFEKDTILPAENTIVLKTTRELKKGETGEVIRIPVFEGNEEMAHLNWHIDTLKVEVEKISETIPKGSEMEISIKIDESRAIEVSVYFEEYDIEVFATMNTAMDVDPEKLHEEVQKIRVFLEAIVNLVKDKSDAWKIKDIKRLISQAREESPELALQAMEEIIKLRKKLDPILEKSNELIKYYSMRGL